MARILIHSNAVWAACYDDQSEVLTKRGWMLFKDVYTDDTVMTFNKETGVMEWQPILNTTVQYIDNKDLVSIKTRSVDLLVTPNHKILAVASNSSKWILDDASNLFGSSCYVPRTAQWIGDNDVDMFELPSIDIIGRWGTVSHILERAIPVEDWVKFMGYYLSEGYIDHNASEWGNYTVGIRQTKSGLQEMANALQKVTPFKTSIRKDGRVLVRDKQLWSYLKQFGYSYEKFIPQFIKDLSPDLLEIFLLAYIQGDGCRNGNRIAIITSSVQMKDDIQEVAIKAGYGATATAREIGALPSIRGRVINSFHQCYDIYLSKANRLHNIKLGWGTQNYTGNVYCVHVANETLLVRRNGRAVFCGNSGYGVMTKNMVKRFKHRLGHDVAVSAFYGLQGAILNVDGVETFPMGLESWGNDIIEAHVQKFGANCLLTVIDLFVLRDFGKRMPGIWYPYFPLDGDPVSQNFIHQLNGAVEGLTYSKFAKAEFDKVKTPCPIRYIPIGTDTNLYKPILPSIAASKKAAKKQLGYPEDIMLFGMIAANQSIPDRKCFTEQIEAFMKFREKYPNSRLYLHTEPSARRQGVDLIRICELLGATKYVDFPNEYQYHIGYEDARMQLIMNSFDVLLGASAGEGFYVGLVEAQASGTPVITAKNTSMPELTGSGWIVNNHHKDYYALGVWHYRPEVKDIYNAMLAAAESDREDLGIKARQFIMDNRYDWDNVCDDFWKPFFQEVDDRVSCGQMQPVFSLPTFKEDYPTITIASMINEMDNDTNKFLKKVISFDYKSGALDYAFLVSPRTITKFKKWQKVHCPSAKIIEEPVSIEAKTRLEKQVILRNILLDEVRQRGKDYVLFADSDVVDWNDKILRGLLDSHADVVAPLVIMDNTRAFFYDNWSFRAGGTNFTSNPPFHPALANGISMVLMDSVGSFFLARQVALTNAKYAVVDNLSDNAALCKSIIDSGFKVALDPTQVVYHTATEKNCGEAYWHGPIVPQELQDQVKDLLEKDTTGVGVALLDNAYSNYLTAQYIQEKGIRWSYNQSDFHTFYMNSNPMIVDKMYKTVEMPHYLEVETSSKCNMGCLICENTHWQEPPRVMSFDEYKHILDELPDLKWIGLSGIGEHWLAPDFLKMIELTKSRGIYIEQFDNLLHLNKERATAYVDLQFERFIASIDAATPETYEKLRPGSSWTKVISNLSQLMEIKQEKNSYWPEIAFHYIINKYNLHEAPLFLDTVFQLGVKPLFVQYTRLLHSFSAVADSYTEIPPDLKKAIEQRSQTYGIPIQWNADIATIKPSSQTCTAWSMPFVFATGHVIPCCAQNEANNREYQKDTAMGNIFEQSFKDIWYGDKFTQFRKLLHEGGRPAACIGCPIRQFPTKGVK